LTANEIFEGNGYTITLNSGSHLGMFGTTNTGSAGTYPRFSNVTVESTVPFTNWETGYVIRS